MVKTPAHGFYPQRPKGNEERWENENVLPQAPCNTGSSYPLGLSVNITTAEFPQPFHIKMTPLPPLNQFFIMEPCLIFYGTY